VTSFNTYQQYIVQRNSKYTASQNANTCYKIPTCKRMQAYDKYILF